MILRAIPTDVRVLGMLSRSPRIAFTRQVKVGVKERIFFIVIDILGLESSFFMYTSVQSAQLFALFDLKDLLIFMLVCYTLLWLPLLAQGGRRDFPHPASSHPHLRPPPSLHAHSQDGTRSVCSQS